MGLVRLVCIQLQGQHGEMKGAVLLLLNQLAICCHSAEQSIKNYPLNSMPNFINNTCVIFLN